MIKTNKPEIWRENQKLKAALKKAAEFVAARDCPADYEGNHCPLLDDLNSNIECTQERAEKCWIDYWMRGEGEG